MVDQATLKAVFRVIDALDHPHGGRILRLRLQQGEALTLKELRSGAFQATGPEGESLQLEVEGFAVFGGKPSDARLARTGRIDVHVADAAADVGPGWEIAGPA